MSRSCGMDLSGCNLDHVASPSVVVGFTLASLALSLEECLVVLSPPGDS